MAREVIRRAFGLRKLCCSVCGKPIWYCVCGRHVRALRKGGL